MENVYGAKRRKCTVQRGCGECVWCEKEEVHRTERLRRMCTVRKRGSGTYREAVENVYGAKVSKSHRTGRHFIFIRRKFLLCKLKEYI